jgi:hypothetical protein
MAFTVADFRANFPEFADAAVYPPSLVNYWVMNAGLMLNASRWGTWLDLATQLMAAHNIVLEARAIAESVNGETPGVTTGAVVSKGVDKVSISFDVGSSTEEKAGHYNTTIYGTRFWKMTRKVGAGPIQLGYETGIDPLSSANAWPGPWSVLPNPSS